MAVWMAALPVLVKNVSAFGLVGEDEVVEGVGLVIVGLSLAGG